MAEAEQIGIREKAFLVGPEDGRASWVDGTLVIDHVIGKCTDEAYSLVEQHAPAGYESLYHVNQGEKEIRYVLDGRIEAVTEGASFSVSAGELVVFKRGQPHGWRVTGEDPARTLVSCSPPGLEELYHDAGTTAERREIPPADAREAGEIRAVAPDYDIDVLDSRPPE